MHRLFFLRGHAGLRHRDEHGVARVRHVHDGTVGAAQGQELGAGGLQQRLRVAARHGQAGHARHRGRPCAHAALPLQHRPRLQEERGVVGHRRHQRSLTRAERVVLLEHHHEGPQGLPARQQGGRQRRPQGREAEPREQGGGVLQPARMSFQERPPQVARLVEGQLVPGLDAAARRHSQDRALDDHRHRCLVAHDPPHLVEHRPQRHVLRLRGDQGPRELAQPFVQEPALALLLEQAHVFQRHRRRRGQRLQRPRVLGGEAARLVQGVQQPDDAGAGVDGHGEHGLHALGPRGRRIQRVGGRVVADVRLARADDVGGGGRGTERVLRQGLPGRGEARALGQHEVGFRVVEREVADLRPDGFSRAFRERPVSALHVLAEEQERQLRRAQEERLPL